MIWRGKYAGLPQPFPWNRGVWPLFAACVLLLASPIAWAQGECYKECCDIGPTPILVDTTGRGFHLTSADDGVVFDIFGDGHPVKLS